MHCHSNPASACGEFTPEEVVQMSAEHGYSGIVLTNHFMRACIRDGESDAEYVDRYLDDCYRAKREGERIGRLPARYRRYPRSPGVHVRVTGYTEREYAAF